jgi:hypothetical protein
MVRGNAIPRLYPDPIIRRRIFKSSLSPLTAAALFDLQDRIREMLVGGAPYGDWNSEERFTFIRDVVGLLSHVPSFSMADRLGRRRNVDWSPILRWWLAKETLPEHPTPAQVPDWYDYVAKNFIYRAAWALGSSLSALFDESEAAGTGIFPLELDDWPKSGLPWIAFWVKELLNWGSLDPVAVFLLSRGEVVDRRSAEAVAAMYYQEVDPALDANARLDPRRIRNWVDVRAARVPLRPVLRTFQIEAELARPAGEFARESLTVLPVTMNDRLIWIDPAGHQVASSLRPDDWPEASTSYSFTLVVASGRISGEAYLINGS